MSAGPVVQHDFHSGSAEILRLGLGEADIRDLLVGEIGEREQAALEFDRLGLEDQAEAMRAEALIVRRYLK